MIRKLALAAIVLAALGGLVFLFLTSPNPLPQDQLAALPQGDATRGERMFWAGGCASCHAAKEAAGEEKRKLGGGLELVTPFGTFVAPNISPHPDDGIGKWTAADLANAMKAGVSPDGRHYYPAFPFASYARMEDADIADLYAFLMTLPVVEGKAPDHKLGFPFNIRRGLGLWKLLFLGEAPVIAVDESDPAVLRGRYLVEGPGHCGECHTGRNLAGGIVKSQWLAGAPAATGEGFIPNITSGEGGIGSWSQKDIAYYLETGFTPEFDSVGGEMVKVQANMAQLPAEDRDAIAAYLKAIPAHAEAR